MSNIPTQDALDLRPFRPETRSVDSRRLSHLVPWSDRGNLRAVVIRNAPTFGDGVQFSLGTGGSSGDAGKISRRNWMQGTFWRFLALEFLKVFHVRQGGRRKVDVMDPRS